MAASDDQNRLNRERSQDSELEQYGVWVKAGPEDVDESDAEDEAFTLTDLGDDDLTEAEMEILGLDDALSQEPDAFQDTDDEEPLSLDDAIDLDVADEPVDLESSEVFSVDFDNDDELGIPAGAPADTDDEEELLTLDEDDDELTLSLDEGTEELGVDDLELEEPEPLAAEPVDEEADDLDDSFSGGILIDDDLPGGAEDLTLDLNSLDVDAFGEPTAGEAVDVIADDLAAEEASDEMDLADEPSLAPVDEDDELDLESLDLDAEPDVTELDLSTLPDDDDDFAALTDADLGQAPEDDLPELEIDDEIDLDTGAELGEALELDVAMEEPTLESAEDDPLDSLDLDAGFDDLAAVEDDVFDAPEASAPSGDARSLSLLESIERELTSIRSELTDLKSELAQLRSVPPAPPQPKREEEPVEEDEDAAGGFFEDEGDDDETIALTGDELDNIMNTAEFTEETGKSTDYEDVGQPFASLADESSPLQEITLDDAPEDLPSLDLDLGATDDEDSMESLDADIFAGSEDEVEALAGMDIDAELADIDELDDHTIADNHANDEEALPDIEIDDSLVEDLELDAEPETSLEHDIIESLPEGEPEPFFEPDDTLELEPQEDEPISELAAATAAIPPAGTPIPENLKDELRSVINYLDKLLDSLPEKDIKEFAASEHFEVYKRLFAELGLEQ